ncbi:MAG TPA: anti-sigma B factor RsbW [Bacilli bacterium]
MNPIRLQIPAHADYIDLVRLCLYGIATKMGFTYEDIEDMKVAASEACNNAVLHGSPQRTGVIDISFNLSATNLSIVVKDQGPSFNHKEGLEKAESLHNKKMSNLRSGGLGLFLMQTLMDKVEINNSNGTELTLTKFVTAQNSLDKE